MKVTARATRSGGWWAVEVPEVPGAFTQVRRLDQVAAEVADAVATLEDVDPATVELERLDVTLADAADGVALETAVTQARDLARQAEEFQRAASAAMRAAVTSLRGKAGLSVRDVGTVLGVSHQRVAQLESTPTTGAARGAARKVTPAKVAPIKRAPAKTHARPAAAAVTAKRSTPTRRSK